MEKSRRRLRSQIVNKGRIGIRSCQCATKLVNVAGSYKKVPEGGLPMPGEPATYVPGSVRDTSTVAGRKVGLVQRALGLITAFADRPIFVEVPKLSTTKMVLVWSVAVITFVN